MRLQPGLPQTPLGELTELPHIPLLDLGGGECVMERARDGKGSEGEGKGKGREGVDAPGSMV